jgi:general secretion pathway protein A
MNKAQMFLQLNEYLIRQYERNRNTVVIIDEAHNLSPEVLEELRMLSNLETRSQKLLQIMLVGQPELESILNMNDMRQLRQRIPGICRISVLDRDEVRNYLRFRLNVVQANSNGGPYFTDDSFDEIFHYSSGIPRLINILCDRVLLIGYVSNTRTIDGRVVREGVRDLEAHDLPKQGRRISPQ